MREVDGAEALALERLVGQERNPYLMTRRRLELHAVTHEGDVNGTCVDGVPRKEALCRRDDLVAVSGPDANDGSGRKGTLGGVKANAQASAPAEIVDGGGALPLSTPILVDGPLVFRGFDGASGFKGRGSRGVARVLSRHSADRRELG